MKSAGEKKIVIVSSNGSDSKKYHIPASLFTLLVCIIAVMLLAGIGGIMYAISLHNVSSRQRTEIERLREENQEHQFQLQSFSRKVSDLDDQMERLENFHTKFTILAKKDSKLRINKVIEAEEPVLEDRRPSLFPEKNFKHQLDKMYLELDSLKERFPRHEKRLHDIEHLLEFERPLDEYYPPSLSSLPFLTWPLRGSIMSPFGFRMNPFTGRSQLHEGVDISAAVGTPVRAVAEGVVTYRGWDGGYGNTVTLDHGNGFVSRFCHLSRISVKHGQFVRSGDVIGTVGTTGQATGPHLHYEVRLDGKPVNPKRYLPR